MIVRAIQNAKKKVMFARKAGFTEGLSGCFHFYGQAVVLTV